MKISIGSSVNWRVPRLALDDLCDSFDHVGTGISHFAHDGKRLGQGVQSAKHLKFLMLGLVALVPYRQENLYSLGK
jgi:hypothetical protein